MKNWILFVACLILGQGVFAQEICDNGIDDDFDGLIDCVDSTECACNGCSKKQGNVWVFGRNAGLDFNSGSPTPIGPTAIATYEGSSSIADPNGNLLFYTDGGTVWDRNNNPMPNGTGLIGSPSTANAAVIVPLPGSYSLYYVFHAESIDDATHRFCYSIVDLTQNGGMGAVVSKNNLLHSDVCEHLTAIRHCNNQDFWIVAHTRLGNSFLVYELTSTGLNTTVNVQSIGLNYVSGVLGSPHGRSMRASKNGDKIATGSYSAIGVYDFDKSTGNMSNPISLTLPVAFAYGVEFSASGRFLYVNAIRTPSPVYQFDLEAGSPANIQSSRTHLANFGSGQYMNGNPLRGPDDKIYIPQNNGTLSGGTMLAAIQSPDSAGLACNLQFNVVNLSPNRVVYGMPTLINSYEVEPIELTGPTVGCVGIPITLDLEYPSSSCGTDTTYWEYKGSNSFVTTDTTITILPTIAGQDTIVVTAASSCDAYRDTVYLTFSICPEVCGNGIDDDNDGLVDGFDTLDCPCVSMSCGSERYYNLCNGCEAQPQTPTSWSLQQVWQSQVSNSILNTSLPVVGDIDGDCVPEVVTLVGGTIYIINGQDGTTKYSYTPPYTLDNVGTQGALSIADVDEDGNGDIFLITDGSNSAGQEHRLVRYEFNGTGLTEVFMSSTAVGPFTSYDLTYQNYDNASTNIADINYDGNPEIVVGNEVYNAQTGELICEGGAGSVGKMVAWRIPGPTAYGYLNSFPVLADVLPDSYCPNCAGLELVAGNQVYSINIPNGGGAGSGSMNIEVTMPFEDGYNSIADFDLDGELDILTMHGNGITYRFLFTIWNPRTATIMDQLTINTTAHGPGRVAIADLDNDPAKDLEIVIRVGSILRSYKYNRTTSSLVQLANRPVNDASRTGVSIFDFDGDGSNEIAYRDVANLYILRGNDLSVLINPLLGCSSNTGMEYPVIADVNADGQTEILIGCGNNLYLYGNGEAGYFWAPSRRVWNQFSYYNVNVNEDLTIPQVQQKQNLVSDSLEMNSFLQQYPLPAQVPDAAVQIVATNSNTVDSTFVTIEVCNLGDNMLSAATPITFYAVNPTTTTTAPIAAIHPLGNNLEVGACDTLSFSVFGTSGNVFVVVNCDNSIPTPFDLLTDFPMTTIGECDYTNNIDNESILLYTDLLGFETEKAAPLESQLTWQWASIKPKVNVQVEHSTDGVGFHAISSWLEEGTTTWRHKEAQEGANYYRLKIKTEEGQTSYSPTRVVSFDTSPVSFTVIPNPNKGQFILRLSADYDKKAAMSIYNMVGTKVFERSVITPNNYAVEMTPLAQGTYIIALQLANGVVLRRKFIVQ